MAKKRTVKRKVGKRNYNKGVFINCPIDEQYKQLFYACVFTVVHCGFDPRCAEEIRDSSGGRLPKILQMIQESRYGIHDLSRVALDKKTKLPRFNMPFEYGIFYGSRYFGDDEQKKKRCLVLERKKYSYQMFISDINGEDIEAHKNDVKSLIFAVRNFLTNQSRPGTIAGAEKIYGEYLKFKRWLPIKCRREQLKLNKLTYDDFSQLVYAWLENT